MADYLEYDGFCVSSNTPVEGPAIIDNVIAVGLHKTDERCEILMSGVDKPLLEFTVDKDSFVDWYYPKAQIWVPGGQSVFCSNKNVDCHFKWYRMSDGA